MSEQVHKNAKGSTATNLLSFIERVERLVEERTALNVDIREIFAEAKARGFDVKAMREIIKQRKMEPEVLSELSETVQVYKDALH